MPEPRVAEQFDSLERQSDTLRFGMWLFLASELLLFSGLFALYAAYRCEYAVDFVRALHRNTLVYGTANTYVLLTSSFTVALAVWSLRSAAPRRAALLGGLSALLGLVFLVIKAIEYVIHIREGAVPGPYYHFAAQPALGANRFFTLYWVTTGAHALHVIAGIGVLIFISGRAARGRYSAGDYTKFEMGALYWHFVDVMWLFIWPIFYLA
jgi:cytochrome c oxidase subunit 3